MTQLEFLNKLAEKISAKYFIDGQKVFIGRAFDTYHFDISCLNDKIEINIYGKHAIHTLYQPYYATTFNKETFVSLAKILRSNLSYSDFISQIDEFAQKNLWVTSDAWRVKYSNYVFDCYISPQGGVMYLN